MKVFHVASEVAPLAKTGGLADVVGALPRALAGVGVHPTVIAPRYASIDTDRYAIARRLRTLTVPMGATDVEVGVFEGRLPGGGGSIYLVDHPPSFDRKGLYGEGGTDYPDNAFRFALLARAALEIARTMAGWPDVVHAHDWQAALALHELARGRPPGAPKTGKVLTIHNLAFQGLFPKAIVGQLDLGWEHYTAAGFEFFDKVSTLKAGIVAADRITTVSPRYAQEIQTPEMGCGLEGLLAERADRLVGILNGVDLEVWDPERDPALPLPFSRDDPEGKAACKQALQRELRLPVRSDLPLIGTVSRLTEQKGFDLVLDAADALGRLDLQVAVLGTGDPDIERALVALAKRYPSRFAVRIAYDDALAHRIEAGSDLFLMPSRFEPCGLNQMYSLRYGTPPIVRAVGGLDDTVIDWDARSRTGTGFKFEEYSSDALVIAIRRALAAWSDRPTWQALVGQTMRQDFSWRASAQRYAALYEDVVRELRKP